MASESLLAWLACALGLAVHNLAVLPPNNIIACKEGSTV